MSDQAPVEVRRKRVSPFRFLQEVREETRKVILAVAQGNHDHHRHGLRHGGDRSIFFLVSDQIIRIAVTFVLGIGS